MNKYIVTAPDGSIHKRNTQNHTYNYAVLVMHTKEHRTKLLLNWIANDERRIAEYVSREGGEKFIARLHKEIAKASKELANIADVWSAVAWRRDYSSAVQEANRITDSITKGFNSVVAVIVVETTQVN